MFDASVASARGWEQGASALFFDVLSSAEAAGVVKVLQRGKRAASDPVDGPLYSFLSSSVQL